MSTTAKNIVKKFYQTDFVTDAQAGKSLLHDDIVLVSGIVQRDSP